MPEKTLPYETPPPDRRRRPPHALTTLVLGAVSMALVVVGPGFRVAQPIEFPSNRPVLALGLLASVTSLLGIASALGSIYRSRRLHPSAFIGGGLSVIGLAFPYEVVQELLSGF